MPDTALPKQQKQPRSRLPSFGRPVKITKRSKTRQNREEQQSSDFASVLKKNLDEEGTNSPVSRPIARVNFLSPSDRQLFMELAQTMREHTDTLREVHGLEPIDRSVPEPEPQEVEAEEASDDVAPEHVQTAKPAETTDESTEPRTGEPGAAPGDEA